MTLSSTTIRNSIAATLLALALVGILVMVMRGLPGTPDIETLRTVQWTWDGPLELSPERGRIALLYSLVEDGSLRFSPAVARLAVPDLAILPSGEYVSLFSPGPSFLFVPGYLIGKFFGASIVGASATNLLFALLNFWLIRAIALRLGAKPLAAILGGLAFLLASPALAYAASLYQHHVSVFLLLFSLWGFLRFTGLFSVGLAWFACTLSIVIDNPNLFLMLPIGLYSLWRLAEVAYGTGTVTFKRTARLSAGLVVAAAFFLLPMLFLGWYNQTANGSPFQLPGTLQTVDEIGPDDKPRASSYEAQVLTTEQQAQLRSAGVGEKSAVGFFKTRNLYNGFFIHFLSPDRGIIFFAPVMLLGVFGLFVLWKQGHALLTLILGSLGVNVLLYSMWGDPWGGWAFGSRYLIPTYALLSIGIAVGLTSFSRRGILLALFLPLFVYSAWVNSLGAITTSTNPPKVEVLALEKQSGHEEKYTFMRNWEYLTKKYHPVGAKAFVYQVWAKHHVSPVVYHTVLFTLILLITLPFIMALGWSYLRSRHP